MPDLVCAVVVRPALHCAPYGPRAIDTVKSFPSCEEHNRKSQRRAYQGGDKRRTGRVHPSSPFKCGSRRYTEEEHGRCARIEHGSTMPASNRPNRSE